MTYLLVFDYERFLEQCQRSPDGSLTRETMAEKIMPYLDGKPATIISESFEKTNSVADAINRFSEINFKSCPIKYENDTDEEDFTSILHDTRNDKTEKIETVLLATTQNPIRYFKEYFTGRSLKTRLWLHTIQNGGVLVLNYENDTIKLIEPDPIKPRKYLS